MTPHLGDPPARACLDVARGVLNGLTGCSAAQGLTALTQAAHDHNVPVFALAAAGEVTGLSEITHVRPIVGDPASDVSRLLGLEGLTVTQVEVDDAGGRMMHVVTADELAAACPSCGVLSTAGTGWVQTRPRDIPYGTAGLRLVWRKRRWRCTEVVCGRGSFTEAIPAVPARARLTVRLRAELAHAVAEQHRCVAETAAHYQVGWATVHDAFIAHVSEPLAAPAPPVRVLGIDETRRGKPIWTQDPDTHRWQLACDRWHTGFVDAAGTGGLLAQVQGRSAAVVTAWLRAQPEVWRHGITHVAIDLSASYAKAVRDGLPDAVLVADRFHVIHLTNDTVTAVRQRVIREDQGRRGRRTDPAWRVRRRLLTAHERLRVNAGNVRSDVEYVGRHRWPGAGDPARLRRQRRGSIVVEFDLHHDALLFCVRTACRRRSGCTAESVPSHRTRPDRRSAAAPVG